MTNQELINMAINARKSSYAPYSDFKVGAALLALSGKVYTGCNIENAAYSPTNCAERTAFFKAVSEGEHDFKKIAIVCGYNEPLNQYCSPCGVCLQVMSEFCGRDFEIILAKNAEDYKIYTLGDLLPNAYTLKKKN
jgi:cytidine deaminase